MEIPLSRNPKINESLNKRKSFPTNKKFERSLKLLREKMLEYSNELGLDNPNYKYYTYKNLPLNNISFINTSRNKYHRSKSTKKNFNLKPYLRTFNKSDKNKLISNVSKKAINNKIGNIILSNLNTSKSEYNDIINYDEIYNININDYSKPKEIIMLNKILKNQNKDFKVKAAEMRNKINELLNNLKSVRVENQKINNDRKKLISRIVYLENELNINKDLSLKEIEVKNNNIENLKAQILKMKVILEK